MANRHSKSDRPAEAEAKRNDHEVRADEDPKDPTHGQDPDVEKVEDADHGLVEMAPEDIKIDPELSQLLDLPTEEQIACLEKDLVADGACRDPLVVSLEEGFLVDGHTRLKLIMKHGLKFLVQRKSFKDRTEAKYWMYMNQNGKRRVSAEGLSYLRGREYNDAENHQGHRSDLTSGQEVRKSPKTLLAEKFMVDEKTIQRDGAFARDMDAIIETCGNEILHQIRTRKVKVSRGDIKELAELAKTAAGRTKLKAEVKAILENKKRVKEKAPKLTLAQKWVANWEAAKEEDQRKLEFLLKKEKAAALVAVVQTKQDAPQEEDDSEDTDTANEEE